MAGRILHNAFGIKKMQSFQTNLGRVPNPECSGADPPFPDSGNDPQGRC